MKENIIGRHSVDYFERGDFVSWFNLSSFSEESGIISDIYIRHPFKLRNTGYVYAKIERVNGGIIEVLLTRLKIESKVKKL